MEGEQLFLSIVDKASGLPMVNVERDAFLTKQFSSKNYNLSTIVNEGPVNAGVSKAELRKIAEGVIKLARTEVTAISAAAGIPGGFAMAGTIPADMAQYYGFLLNVAQKLMYLYGIEDIKNISDGSKNALIVALGVMLGAEAANNGIRAICKTCAVSLEKKLASQFLTKGTIYPIAKKVCAQLGVKLTKQAFAKGVGKAVPIVGAVLSGGLTYATFGPSCKKLLNALEDEMF